MYIPLAFRASTALPGCRRSRSLLSLRVPERAKRTFSRRVDAKGRIEKRERRRAEKFRLGDETASSGVRLFFRDRKCGDRRDAIASVTSRERTMRVHARASSVWSTRKSKEAHSLNAANFAAFASFAFLPALCLRMEEVVVVRAFGSAAGLW